MIVNQRSALVEYIARKSLVCLTLTFLVNLIMNLLKITSFLGDRSDVSMQAYFLGITQLTNFGFAESSISLRLISLISGVYTFFRNCRVDVAG